MATVLAMRLCVLEGQGNEGATGEASDVPCHVPHMACSGQSCKTRAGRLSVAPDGDLDGGFPAAIPAFSNVAVNWAC